MLWSFNTIPISGRMDRASAAETVDSGSIVGQTKDYRNWYSQLPA